MNTLVYISRHSDKETKMSAISNNNNLNYKHID